MSNSIQIEKQAAAWLAQRDANHWSDADERALNTWLEAAGAHRIAFIRLEAAWQQTRRLKALVAGLPRNAAVRSTGWHLPPLFNSRVEDAGAIRPTLRYRPWRRYSAAAAAGLVAAAVAAWYFRPLGIEYRTAIGSLTTASLADGSKVVLNTDSDIRSAITATARQIELERGEVFFEVAKDPKRPFIVSAGDKRIVAVGTQFSVRREAEEVHVVVTEGLVRISRMAGKREEPLAWLPAGSTANAGGAGALVQNRSLSEVEESLSWRSGFIVFHHDLLADAVAEFNRYTTRKIVIDDPAVAAIRIDGKIGSNNVDAFLRLLQDGFPVRAERRGDRIMLLHR